MTLMRLGAVAAIIGGLLRILDAFWIPVPSIAAALYLLTDVFLLLGAAALWGTRPGVLGKAGLIVFVIGIALVRLSAVGFGGYQTGAGIALLGLAVYAADALRGGLSWPALAWLVALAFGIAGALGAAAPGLMLLCAGVAFGLGFIAAGGEMLYAARHEP